MLEPYDAPSMNALEKLSLWTTLATLYLSLFLVYSALSDTARMAISALLILSECGPECDMTQLSESMSEGWSERLCE